MDQTIGLSPERIPLGVAQGRGLSPEKVNWKRLDPNRFFAPYVVVGNIDAATVRITLTPSASEIYSPYSGSIYFDAATAKITFTPSGVDIGPAPDVTPVTPLPSFPPVSPPVVVKWTMVHYTHDEYALGEVNPKNLDFAIYLNRIGYCNYDIDVSHVLGIKQNTSPYETDFVLFRNEEAVMGGEHTNVSLSDIEGGIISVAGQDWGHWLERQLWPFDPADPLLYNYLVADRDIALVVKDLLTQITAFPDCLVLDLSALALTGNLINYKIEINDTEAMYSKLAQLSQRSPGFDFEITWDKKVLLYYPKKGSQVGVNLVQGHNIYEVQYTNNGPVATTTLGTARASSSQIGWVVNSTAPQYRRSMANTEFSDITEEQQLIDSTEAEAARNIAPHRELTLKVIREAIDIWSLARPGDTVHVDAETGYEHIKDDFRVVGMQCTTNDEGDEEWLITVDDGTLSL